MTFYVRVKNTFHPTQITVLIFYILYMTKMSYLTMFLVYCMVKTFHYQYVHLKIC